mmetsp:Transcript_37157/g.60634  ORF Transcript_37157/g.60634 Transcript_37157/m.60634 type:complete len:136 (+) Transcript_37157:63-470(+)
MAVFCLCRSTGGWLHVHGNIPTVERQKWTHWLCHSLARIAAEQRRDETNPNIWVVGCTHVENVKSFAPKADHVVADVLVGPCNSHERLLLEGRCCSMAGVVDSSGTFTASPLDIVSPPSCALDKEGILHQNWLHS